MMKPVLTAVAAALVVGAVVACSARHRRTRPFSEACTDGSTNTVDVNAYGGITTAETQFNVLNPSGTFCYIVPF